MKKPRETRLCYSRRSIETLWRFPCRASQAVARARAVGAFLKTRQLLLSPLSRARPDRVPRSRAQRGYPVSTGNFKTMFCSVAGQKSLKSLKMIILIDVFYYCIKRVVLHKINHFLTRQRRKRKILHFLRRFRLNYRVSM